MLALWTFAMLSACAGPGVPSVYQPGGSPQSMVHTGDFTLEIATSRDRWDAGQPIEVTATLTYDGPGATTIIGASSGPIAFGVREIGGTREMGESLTMDAMPRVIGPEPYVVEYRKSGGWSPGDDPNEAFYEHFFADPEFRLPAGRWEVTAWARFATEERGPYTVDTRARLVLMVE
jgi:hypothetical protein